MRVSRVRHHVLHGKEVSYSDGSEAPNLAKPVPREEGTSGKRQGKRKEKNEPVE